MRNTHKPSDILKKQYLKQQLCLCTHTTGSLALSFSIFLFLTCARARALSLAFSLKHTHLCATHTASSSRSSRFPHVRERARTRARTRACALFLYFSHTPMRNTHKPSDILKKQHLMQQLCLCTHTIRLHLLSLSSSLSFFFSRARARTHTLSFCLKHTHLCATHTGRVTFSRNSISCNSCASAHILQALSLSLALSLSPHARALSPSLAPMHNTHKPRDILKKQYLMQQLRLCTHTIGSVCLSQSLFLLRARARAHTHTVSLSLSLSHTYAQHTRAK